MLIRRISWLWLGGITAGIVAAACSVGSVTTVAVAASRPLLQVAQNTGITRVSYSEYPLSDDAAAAQVVRSPWEPRPENYTANHTMPTPAQLAALKPLPNLNSDSAIIFKVTGHFTGTTDEILQWAAAKWGFPIDLVRANAVQESHWRQAQEGDCKHDNLFCTGPGVVDHGDSWGILQVKQRSFKIPALLPNGEPCEDPGNGTNAITQCLPLSHFSTAFNADYKLMWQRACMNKTLPYLKVHHAIGGHPEYMDATGDELLWGCVGAWYNGWYSGEDTLRYIAKVQGSLQNRDWTKSKF
jgi:hypothetical protein